MIFSYIFNVVYKGYTKSGDDHPGIYAVGIVSLMQFFAVLFAIMLPVRLKAVTLSVDYRVYGLIVLVLMFVNYLYFYKVNTPTKVSERMDSLAPNKIKVLKSLTWIYAIVLIGLFFLLANLPK